MPGLDLAKKVKFLLPSELFGYLRCTIALKSPSSPEALNHPGSEQISSADGISAAVFREAVLYRHFASVRQFWEEFDMAYDEIKHYDFPCPADAPHLSLDAGEAGLFGG